MKQLSRLFCILFSLLFASTIFAQFADVPVVWKASIERTATDSAIITIEGKVEEGWHVFSQYTSEEGSLPAELDFLGEGFILDGKAEESETKVQYNDIFEVDETIFVGDVIFTQKLSIQDTKLEKITAKLYYQICKEVCIADEQVFVFDGLPSLGKTNISTDANKTNISKDKAENTLLLDLKNKEILNADLDKHRKENNLLEIFILGFIGGLFAILMPCVFPLIPLTVSFFSKQAKKGKQNALLYGLFIFGIYILLSIPFHLLDYVDPSILNNIASNKWLNFSFFIAFIIFAFSFFGFYELTIPSKWVNKIDSASDVGGVIGILFMALTLILVSFSCTGPILGSLLASSLSSEGGATQLSIGLGGFGLALALPFTLFAMFPNWLTALPKSGSWMNKLKVNLGFVELALAMKFLSNADLVGHWDILKKEVFLGIWLLIFLAMFLYNLGFIRFTELDKGKKIQLSDVILAGFAFVFVVYLSFGLKKDSHLSILSGLLPPSYYSLYQKENDCPLNLNCYKDFETGLEAAKYEKKPIILDFTGYSCVNCRKMEDNVWRIPKIKKLLSDEYILISLYVDDRETKLPDSLQFVYTIDKSITKEIKTVGDKWSTFQYANFQVASQPYYVLLSPDLEILAPAAQYTEAEEYYQWLNTGLIKFKEK